MYLKLIFAAALSAIFILFPASAFAAVEAAPPQGFGAVAWAMEMSGPMPKMMIIGLILIAVMLAVTIIIAKLSDKEDKK